MIINEMYGIKQPNTVVFSFARMQPPTIGHEKLVKTIIETAKANHADHVLYLSQKNDDTYNPLLWEDKLNMAKTAFSGLTISEDKNIKTPYDALYKLCEKYENVILVVGSDRVDDFEEMNQYTESYGAKSFKVMECGKRDALSNAVEGISSSKARQLAYDCNFKEFAKILPTSLSENYKKSIFRKLREGKYEHIWYHGSGMDFDKFNFNNDSRYDNVNPAGIYMTKDEEIAQQYAAKNKDGIVYEIEPNIYNPYYPGKSEVTPAMLDSYKESLGELLGYTDSRIQMLLRDFAKSGEMKPDLYGSIKTKAMMAGGYDSTFFKDFGFNSLVVFDPDDVTILNKYKPQKLVKDPEYDQYVKQDKKPKQNKKPTDQDTSDELGKEF